VRDAATWTKEMASRFADLSKDTLAKIYGWVTKQTPEQVAESTAAHLTQEAGERLKTVWQNTVQRLKYGTTLPDWVKAIHETQLRNAQASQDEGISHERALNANIGTDDTLRAKALDALKGDEANFKELPPKLQNVVQASRSTIDQKTFKILTQLGNLLPNDLRDRLGSNIGQYLIRPYRMFEDPDAQLASITEGQQNGLIHDFMTQLGMTHAEAVSAYNEFTDRDKLGGVHNMLQGRGTFAGKDVSSFIKRHDLWNSMKVVLGEYTDPAELVRRTIEKQNSILNNDTAQQAIREQGLANGQLRTIERPGDVRFQPASEQGLKYDRLKDLFTDRDFRKKFFENDVFAPQKDTNAIGKIIHTVTSLTNQFLVGLNPKIIVPQFDADYAANLMQGYITPKGYLRGVKEAGRSVGVGDPNYVTDPLAVQKRQNLISEGILGKSAAEGVLTPDRQRGANLADYIPGYRKLSELNAKTVGGASNAAKVARYENYELPNYTKAFAYDIAKANPELKPFYVNEQAAKQGKEKAGQVMRDTSHYYETLPHAVKFTGKYIPGTNYFLNFPYNIYRTVFNGVSIAKSDIARGVETGNPVFLRIGAQRLAAIGAFLTATAYVGNALNSKVSAAKQAAFKRSFMPIYDQKEETAFDGDIDANHARYSPLSYLNPYTLVTKGANDALAQKSVPDALKSLGGTIGMQFGGDNPVYTAASQAITNRDAYGRPIAYPQDAHPGLKRAGYALGQLQPQVLPFFENVYKGLTNQTSPTGKKFSATDQALSLGGLRTRDVSPLSEFTYRAKDALNQLNTIQQGYRSEVKANPDQAQQAFAKAQAANQAVYQTLFNTRDDLKTLGATDAQVADQLKNAGFSDLSVGQIMQGKGTPPSLPKPKELLDAGQANNTILAVANDAVNKFNESSAIKGLTENILKNPTADNVRQQLIQGVKDGSIPSVNGQPDPAFIQKLNNAYKLAARDQGQTEQLREIKQLGASSTDNARAKEIYRILNQDLNDNQERLAFYQKLKQEGLITPLVARQYQAIANTGQPSAASVRQK